MDKSRRFLIYAVSLAMLIATCAIALVSCTNRPVSNVIDYSIDNNFQVDVAEFSDSRVYTPRGKTGRYGLIFYVGTGIKPEYYDYLGYRLARQGYAVVMPNIKAFLAYINYKQNESAFDNYPDVKFFVGGHSQGGGAAVKRTQENADRVLGAVLLAPLCFREDNLHGLNMPTLLLEASGDHVLSDIQKDDARSRFDENMLTNHTIIPGAHMSFSTYDDDDGLRFFNGDGDGITEDQKEMQRELTANYVLDFMNGIVRAL